MSLWHYRIDQMMVEVERLGAEIRQADLVGQDERRERLLHRQAELLQKTIRELGAIAADTAERDPEQREFFHQLAVACAHLSEQGEAMLETIEKETT